MKAMYTRKEFTPSRQTKQRGGDVTLINKPNNLEANKNGIIQCICVYREREREEGWETETDEETEKEG